MSFVQSFLFEFNDENMLLCNTHSRVKECNAYKFVLNMGKIFLWFVLSFNKFRFETINVVKEWDFLEHRHCGRDVFKIFLDSVIIFP